MSGTYQTTCSYCGVGCGIKIHKDRYGKLSLEGDQDHPASKGMLCSKGMNLHYTVMDQQDRLLYPEMRWNRYQPRQRVTWDQALDRASSVFQSLIKKYGPDSVGLYVSGQLLTEEYYIANKLTKGFLGTNNIDTNSRLCMSSAVVGYKKSLGEDSVPISYADIEQADCFFITGANPAWCHPIIFRRIEAQKQNNPDTKIIVADPRETQTCAYADIHLQLNPGTDTVLYHALSRCLIENDAIDQQFIESHTDGYEALKEKAMARTVEEAAEICGVTPEEIREAAQYIGDAEGFISMWAMGLNQSSVGVTKNLALINLHLITGKIGKPGNGPFSLTGQPNAMGGREVGGLSTMLAAHRELNNPEHRQEVADFWGVDSVREQPGLTAMDMIDSLESGKMKAIWIICTNPLTSMPNARKVEAALRKARFVVVQDISGNASTISSADLVLPAAGYLEKEGTMTNSDRRVNYLEKVVDPPGEALPDAEILCRFARKMGYEEQFNYNSFEEIFKEHAALTKGTNIDISGLDYSILRQKRMVQWPYPEGATEGTPRLFTDNVFYTDNGKAKIHGEDPWNASEEVSPDYPLVLTSGRIRDQWHTMTRTGKVGKLRTHIREPFLEIHPEDAEARGIRHNEVVTVNNQRGNVRVKASVSNSIKQGVVFLPMHWGRNLHNDLSRSNNVTHEQYDPRSQQPDLKYAAVEVQPYKAAKQKIIVVGAGAGAYRFVTRHRELNERDEIVVFSKEDTPFYDRVKLPEYVSRHKSWEDLIKMQEDACADLKIDLKKGVGVQEIHPELKTVKDENGTQHHYDKLIIGTGSSANRPPGFPEHLEHVYTIRNRTDAERLMGELDSINNVAVVGGGLLGLEMADALTHRNKGVYVIQRSSRLMERVLDNVASELLYEEMADRNVNVHLNDEIREVLGRNSVEGIRLKSTNKIISCEAVIYAIGTRPNIALAQDAGLKCNRGVVVSETMQTSNPDIYAIGEVAEFREQLFGITAAAEEQADIVVNHMAGDPESIYEGSLSMNILKIDGVELCSLGQVHAPPHNDEYEEVKYIDKAQRYYKKCIIHKDRLVGAILMGDKSEFGEFKSMIQDQTELGSQRNQLLLGSGNGKQVKGSLVCSCNRVGDGNIEKVIKDGASDLDSVCSQTGAGTGCGSCKPEVQAILDQMKTPAT